MAGLGVAAAAGVACALMLAASPGTAGAASKRAVDIGATVSVLEAGFFRVDVDAAFTGFPGDFSASLQYGTSTAYGSTCCDRSGLDEAMSPQTMGVTGLQDGTTYHFRVVASDSSGTYYSDDLAVTTPTSGAPGIAMHSGGYDSSLECFTGDVQVDTKGLDTTWYAAAGASPTLAGAVTAAPQLVAGYPWGDAWLYGGGTGLSLCVQPSSSGLVYLQLHAQNARGSTDGPVLTYTAATTTSGGTTTTTSGGGPATTTVVDEQRPALATTVLPNGVVGQPYRYALPLSHGAPPYTVALNGFDEKTAPGLQLESDGVIDGTPSAEGVYYTNIKVFDQRYPPDGGPASVFTLTMTVAQTAPPATTVTTGAVTTGRRPPSPPWWTSCVQMNKRYPHGVGRVGARDKTSGKPVTSFRRSNALYALAVRHNPNLDRDRDGIACEHR